MPCPARLRPAFLPFVLAVLLTAPAAAESGLEVPPAEKLLRLADILLMEPGFAQARQLAAEWRTYAEKLVTDERRAAELEQLANHPAIVGFVQNPKGQLAPVFEKEIHHILGHFGRGAIQAWRLRSVDDRTVLAHRPGRLATVDTSVTRRDIGARFFSIPISAVGFNFTLDAEWDITRLPDFPVNEAYSGYLFLTTDAGMHLVAGPGSLPDSAYRFISQNKFVADPFGVQHNLRVFATPGKDLNLIICYPFAGIAFYAVRGGIILVFLVAAVLALVKIRRFAQALGHMMENRNGKWLQEHYDRSLTLNEQAVGLSENAVGVATALRERETQVLGEIGRQMKEFHASLTGEVRQWVEETGRAGAQPRPSEAPKKEIVRPLHKKKIRKEPILIEHDAKPDIHVGIELDLPLTDERVSPPEEKLALVHSLRQRAREKTTTMDPIRDEKIDNYDYVAPEPMPLPVVAAAPVDSDANADLEYIQKFRYAGKPRVLPIQTSAARSETLRMREDLSRQTLVVGEEE